jgi:hypothetical protein
MSYFDSGDKIDQWLLKRRSKYSSSENWKLLRTSKQPTDILWSATANTYIEKKVIELTTRMDSRPEMEEVEALRHGKTEEFPSFERYIKETKNYSMTYLGDESPMFIPWAVNPDESGGTPDVANIIQEGEAVKIDYGCELKNPVNAAYHFRRLRWKSQWDIKEGYPSCYAQIQDLIRINNAFGWDFVSHDNRQLSKAAQIKIIEVRPDRKFIDNLELRIQLAIKEKYKILSEHMGAELKNRNDYLNFINQ